VTAVVVKDGKYLITQRSMQEERWPGKWTVPGGKLRKSDFDSLPKDTINAWYNVLDRTLRTEVKEEVNLEIKNIEYITSIIAEHGDKYSMIISMIADYDSGEIKLQEGETDDYAWVSVEEAKKYDLIDGIYEEIVMADKKQKGIKEEWKRG
jgi:8-oxo-dGTP pyrophosphatase MutT (NUDIX family)